MCIRDRQASNPYAYIQAHQEEYENIKKLGGEKALQYMPVSYTHLDVYKRQIQY